MNKKEFLQSLREKLTQMPKEEVDAALRYYEEYFDEAGVENEERVLSELGTPDKIAKQILSESGIKEEKKKGKVTMWITIGIILCVIVLGAIFSNHKGSEAIAPNGEPITNGTSRYTDIEKAVDAFKNINVEVDMMDVKIQEGEDYKIVIHCLATDEVTYKVSNGTLTCTQKNTQEFNNRKNTMTIYMPKETKLDVVDISSGMGDSRLINVGASSIISDNGMGDFEVTDIACDNLEVELGMGDAKVTGLVKGNIEIEDGMGDVKLNLTGKKTDYNYEITRGMGTVEIDGMKQTGVGDIEEDNKASNNITVSNGMGDTTIAFK